MADLKGAFYGRGSAPTLFIIFWVKVERQKNALGRLKFNRHQSESLRIFKKLLASAAADFK